MDWDKIKKELQAPFNWSDVKFRVGATNSDRTKGIALAYIDNRAIQDRLDQVVGVGRWRNEFKKWGENAQICGISIYDDDTGEWVTKWDGAENTKIEPVKGGLSDAQKRAAAQWGIGRYLYKLKDQWVDIKKVGSSYSLVERPSLPDWAYDRGELNQAHVNALTKKVNQKGFTEELVCEKYMLEKYSELNLTQMSAIIKRLDDYQNVAEGEEPKLKEGKI